MATLRFSTLHMRDVYLNNSARKSLGLASNDSWGLVQANSKFQVMQGTIPTQSEISTAASNFRSGDVLITKNVSNGQGSFDASNDLIKMNSTIQTATQTGIASWFIWTGHISFPSPVFIGSITSPGGGGDMSLTNLNIVSGQQYTIGPATFLFDQRDFTY